VRAFGLQSALQDVDRVEVLHGPQGTLFGKNTTGGAVSIITKSPGSQYGGYLTAGYGNFNYYEVTGAVDLPINDKFALRLVASDSAHDGYEHSTSTGQGLNADDHWSFRGHAVFKPTDHIKVELIGDTYQSTDGPTFSRVTTINPANAGLMLGGAAVALYGSDTPANEARAQSVIMANYGWPPKNGPWTNGQARTPQSRFETSGAVLNAEWDLNNVTFKSITGWRGYSETPSFVLNPTPYGFPYTGTTPTRGNFYSEEFQALGSLFDSRLKYVAGVYGSYEDDTPDQFVAAPNGADRIKNSSEAGFAQVDYRIAPQWTITAGGRYTNDVRYIQQFWPAPCAAPYVTDASACVRTRQAAFPEWGYLLSLDWRPTPDLMLYVKTSQAEIAGGFNPDTIGSPPATGPASIFSPETLVNYEVGAKDELLDHRVRINVAAFWANDTNLQRNVIVASGGAAGSSLTQVVHNAGRARIPGVEAELTAKPTHELTLSGSVGYIAPKYLQYSEAGPGGTTISLLNQPWPTPKLTYSLGAHYVHDMDWGNGFADINWSGQGGFSTCVTCTDQVGPYQHAYGILNGNVGVELTKWDVRINVFGRNLLNKEYLNFTINLADTNAGGLFGYNAGIVGDPRTYGIEVTKRF
jgi:iron complex outermembrane receptor protein